MNNIARLAILLLLFASCNEKSKQQSDEEAININIDSLESLAFNKFENEPLEAIELFKKVAENYKRNRNNQKSGQTYLNIAGIYEEKLSEFSKALTYGKKSLNDWTLARDTMQMANLYKYIGYLEGLNGNYKQAEDDIRTSIKFYEKLSFKEGIAVSHINMAKVQILKSNFEEAELFYKRSKNFWQQQRNNSRIFDNNLVGIKIYHNTSQIDEASKLIQENKSIIKDEEINKFLIEKFNEIVNEM